MELATVALDSLLPKLANLLSDEYKLQKGVRGEIMFLQAEMESMQAALKRVSKLPAHQIDDLNKIRARDLKELVYDIEDTVDAFMVRVDAPVHAKPHGFRKFLDRTMGLLTRFKNRHHIADDIQDIKRRIDEVSHRRERYKFEDVAAQPDTTVMDPRMPGIFKEAAMLVGTDGPAEKISNLLTQGKGVHKQKLTVVSIVGVGGLGKTTIANLVYERLRGQFDCQAFVSVSLNPNVKQIFGSILRQISKDPCTSAGEKDPQELIRSITDILINKRYFIVIDDVWDEEAWEIIKTILVDNNVGSRVIVTTRNIDVVNFPSVDVEVYELDPLSDEDSRRLLCKRVFKENEEICPELEEVANKILKKCGGIPLVIITIASMLARIPNKTKYKWYDVYNSMGHGLRKEGDKLDNMRKILHLSYRALPSYLKPCLLYLSMFPEDHEVPRSELVRLWVAEGFVKEENESNSYEIGDGYFIELVNRSMIQPIYINKFGVAEACQVHDMILDLIISLSVEENFSTIPRGPQHKYAPPKIRRISLHQNVDGNKEDKEEEQMILPAIVDMSHARSLISSGDAVQWMPPLSKFSVLRVLSLEVVPIKIIHPKDLGSLHHLRYLKLDGQLDPKLLEAIGNLKFLKTLDLSSSFIEELPPCIFQLRQLECLLLHWTVRLPDGIGNLRLLQELAELNVEKSPNTLAELGMLTELRVLTISELDENCMKTFLQSLSNLGNIRTLNFTSYTTKRCYEWCSLDIMSDEWRGPVLLQNFDGRKLPFSQLPQWFSSLSELSCLSITVGKLRPDHFQLLGALPALHFLELKVTYTITEVPLVIGSDMPFRNLAEFRFNHDTGSWLVFGQGVMPRLQRLLSPFSFYHIMTKGFDVGLENLTSLKHVTVRVYCGSTSTREVEDVETKIRDAVDSHPNHPTLSLEKQYLAVPGSSRNLNKLKRSIRPAEFRRRRR